MDKLYHKISKIKGCPRFVPTAFFVTTSISNTFRFRHGFARTQQEPPEIDNKSIKMLTKINTPN